MTVHFIEKVFKKDGVIVNFETSPVGFHDAQEAHGNLTAMNFTAVADNQYLLIKDGQEIHAKVKSISIV